MNPPAFALASASSAVTALIGTAPVRFYLFGEAVESTAKPYAVWQTITGTAENYLNQRPDADTFGCQVDVYGTSASSVRAVAKALRDAYEGRAYITRWGGESRDTETNLYRYSFDVEFITLRVGHGLRVLLDMAGEPIRDMEGAPIYDEH